MPADRAPKPLPLPTMQERAEAAKAARALRAAIADPSTMGEPLRAFVDSTLRGHSGLLTVWDSLPGYRILNGRHMHLLLPGWTYTRAEVVAEMIPDLEAPAERGVQPTEATSGVGGGDA